MIDNIPLELATRKVHSYAHRDELMQDHDNAMECRDCEDFLRAGIDAFSILRSAEQFLREASYEGIYDFTPELKEAIDLLYQMWLGPCEHAEKWVSKLAERGYRPDNLEEFQEACETVQEIVESRDWHNRVAETFRVAAHAEDW